MKLYVCGKCYSIVACQKENEQVKFCLECRKFIFSHIPCEEYLKATEVKLDCICFECEEKELSKLN